MSPMMAMPGASSAIGLDVSTVVDAMAMNLPEEATWCAALTMHTYMSFLRFTCLAGMMISTESALSVPVSDIDVISSR